MLQQNGQQNNRNGPHGYVYQPVIDAPYALCPGCADGAPPREHDDTAAEPMQLAFAFAQRRAAP